MADCDHRNSWINDKCFPLITQESVDFIADYAPLVEVGAGTGYLASLLQAVGAEVVPTDAYPPHLGRNPYGWENEHTFVLSLKATTAVKRWPTRNVLMSWPSLGKDWAMKAISAMQPGRYLIYIGEDEHGCTGSPGFHKFLKKNFEFVEYGPMGQFHKLHDTLQVYKRI